MEPGVSRWAVLLPVVLALAGARPLAAQQATPGGPATPAAALEAVPPRPSWDWILGYAARRLSGDSAAWTVALQAIADDGNHLSPPQQRTLEQAVGAAVAAVAQLRAALQPPYPPTCSPALQDAMGAVTEAMGDLDRDAMPPWTQHRHRDQIGGAVAGFRYEIGCYHIPGLPPPPLPAQPPSASPYRAKLGGRILAAPQQQPLAGVRVYIDGLGLQANQPPPFVYPGGPGTAAKAEWQANESVAREAITAADGSWSMVALPPGCYTVTAYRTGFIPVQVVADLPSNLQHACAGFAQGAARALPPQPLDRIDLALAPAQVAAMAYGPLIAADPFTLLDLRFDDTGARLSPDGRFLAFYAALGQLQVWRYDLGREALQALAPGPGTSPEPQGGLHLGWAGSQLSVSELLPSGQVARWIAGSDGLQAFTGTPAAFNAAFARRNLDRVDEAESEDNGRYLVGVNNHGHGDIHLTARDDRDGRVRDLAQGSWGLDGTQFDAQRSIVYYVTSGERPGAIVAYDLNRGAARRLLLPNPAEYLLDAVRVPGGVLFAFSVLGACDWPAPLPQRHIFADNQPWFRTLPHVCFATMPDAAATH